MSSGPTIILVGGLFTTEDGLTIDSRQLMDGDPSSQVAYRTMATSRLWWDTVKTLVEPILHQDLGFAAASGPHHVFELLSGETVKRLSLEDLLGIGTPESRWRLRLPGTPSQEIFKQARVVVDTGHGDNDGGLRMLSRFRALLRWNPSLVLVVPHTHNTQDFFGQLALEGQGEETWKAFQREALANRPTRDREPDPLAYTTVIPTAADFKVTGLIENGRWEDPSDLEAARVLLQTRYDLSIGIWDLAANPTLRSTLLDVVPIRPPPPVEVAVPRIAGLRARSKLATEQQAWEEWADRLGGINTRGWERRRGAGINFRFAMAEWPPKARQPQYPMLSLWLALSKEEVNVRVQCGVQEIVMSGALQRYLLERRALFESIAVGSGCELGRKVPVLWFAPGGTSAPELDWASRGQSITTATPHWVAAFAELGEECRRIAAVPLMDRLMAQGRIRPSNDSQPRT